MFHICPPTFHTLAVWPPPPSLPCFSQAFFIEKGLQSIFYPPPFLPPPALLFSYLWMGVLPISLLQYREKSFFHTLC